MRERERGAWGLVGGEKGGGERQREGGGGRRQLGGHLVKQLLNGGQIVAAVLLQHLGQQTLKKENVKKKIMHLMKDLSKVTTRTLSF